MSSCCKGQGRIFKKVATMTIVKLIYLPLCYFSTVFETNCDHSSVCTVVLFWFPRQHSLTPRRGLLFSWCILVGVVSVSVKSHVRSSVSLVSISLIPSLFARLDIVLLFFDVSREVRSGRCCSNMGVTSAYYQAHSPQFVVFGTFFGLWDGRRILIYFPGSKLRRNGRNLKTCMPGVPTHTVQSFTRLPRTITANDC